MILSPCWNLVELRSAEEEAEELRQWEVIDVRGKNTKRKKEVRRGSYRQSWLLMGEESEVGTTTARKVVSIKYVQQ